MGAFKFRQGRSINLGLVANVDRSTAAPYSFRRGADVVEKMGWLMATIHAIAKPFVKMAQNCRGRGNR
jgi:hypothetical protein